MSSVERASRILCAGIIVLDEVFRVSEFPQPDGKVQANGFFAKARHPGRTVGVSDQDIF